MPPVSAKPAAPKKTVPPAVLTFIVERDTKNKVRLEEIVGELVPDEEPKIAHKDAAVAEKLYISKKQMKVWGDIKGLKVTLEPIY